jgi:hypothetical protein
MTLSSGYRGSFRSPDLRAFWLAAVMFVTAGCAPGLEPKGTRPDPASVRTILFRVAPDNLDALESSRLRGMAERVSRNLGSWGYPVIAEDGESGYSHVMEARVGDVTFKSTPTGLSFTLGNSDPRALDFQKADVLPVDCVLYPAAHPENRASLYMDFVAGEKLKAGRGDSAAMDIYVNHIATVCFNLLDDLKVPRRKPAEPSAGGSPAWMPEVRIEVVEKPAAKTATPTAKAAATPATPPPDADPAASRAAPPETAEMPPVSTETSADEGRKQIVIHNQGAPVILDFGYERK